MDAGQVELGQVIKKHRPAVGLSQEQLAEGSGLHWTFVNQIETDKRNLNINALPHIAAALDIQTLKLIEEAEERPL